MLKIIQNQKLLQRLSPQQIQYIKLLQVPTANLDEKIEEELEINPALEIDPHEEVKIDPYDLSDDLKEETMGENDPQEDISDYLRDENESMSDYHVRENNDDESDERSSPIRQESTFHDHLLSQITLLDLEEQEIAIAEQIIGSIDDDGYLRRDAMSIVDDLAFKENIYVKEKDVIRIIGRVQQLDPAGVAAADLQECLSIQLRRMVPSAVVSDAISVIENYFEEFSKKQFEKIKNQLQLDDEAFKAVNQTILHLTPKPGMAFHDGSKENGYIIPDFFIQNNNGVLELTLNARNAPPLRISEDYKEMLIAYDKGKLKDRQQKEAVTFIKQKLDSAQWFIDSIKQRQHTLLYTMKAIMDYQQAFFLTGNESSLKPMILKDIATIINMDISTVSRVANSKYVQTEYGTFLLKYFFSESITSDSGEEVSTYEVKNLLNELVDKEDKSNPFSDEQLMEMLADKGFKLARRTVAKYREQLQLPVARLRKEA